MNNKEKRAKFRELAQHDRIKTASRFAEELAAPFLPFNEFKQENRVERLPRRALEVGGKKP
jgi:hypothetical protein